MKSKVASFLGIAVMAFGVVSCSSDDESSTKNNNKLVGKWTMTEEQALDSKGKVLEKFVEYNGVCPLDNAEYLAGGIMKSSYYNYSEIVTNCQASIEDGTWKVEGNKLKLGVVEDGLESEAVYTITELDEGIMLLDMPLSRYDLEDYPENTVTIRSVFKKAK